MLNNVVHTVVDGVILLKPEVGVLVGADVLYLTKGQPTVPCILLDLQFYLIGDVLCDDADVYPP